MKKGLLTTLVFLLIIACNNQKTEQTAEPQSNKTDSLQLEKEAEKEPAKQTDVKPVELTTKEANKLVALPLSCITTEFPNKPGQVLVTEDEIENPQQLHPAFFGCFDWHSAVHAHWSLVSLLKQFPDIEKAESIKKQLQENLSAENIQQEVAYFQKEHNNSFERTYGWAWLLKLAEELHTWDNPLAEELATNLQPLTQLITEKYIEFLPKLNYPIRVGEHQNTAFGLGFAYDYAETTKNEKLANLITKRAKDYFLNDNNCPIDWEPSGHDFLSPCLEEIDLMQRILSKETFMMWLEDFMPQLLEKDFDIAVGEVSDRTDGHLVHLDGLNFSRAWVFYNLANKYENLTHLEAIADKHVAYSFPNLVGDSYEGGHWLGSFAIYALNQRKK